MTTTRVRAVAVVALVGTVLCVPAHAQMLGTQMPDPRQMSGVPLPTSDLPVGTLTVRVIRGSLSNPVPNHPVDTTGGASVTKPTNESGRAEFPDLAPGLRIKASTTVNGERLESQEVQIPSTGGVRIMLVATDAEAAGREAEDRRLALSPAQRGIVVLGEQSRFVFEMGEDGLSVFNIFQVLNTARTPVDPAAPVVFVLPEGATRAGLLEGSTPLASVVGDRVEVKGPFPPGMTLLQFAYTLPYAGDTLSVRQVLPVQLTQLTVAAQKIGAMRLSSTQIAQQRDVASEGQTYVLGQGPTVPPGGAVEFSFSGLPHAARWPRNLALALVVLILAAGAFASVRGRGVETTEPARRALQAKRERLFDQLADLEQGQRAGALAPAAYAGRRQQLMTSLERVYAALDEEAAAS
ncbi:MAG TPA: hypothetical protein VNJ03_11420 [Vicinamibacterales bacterium]|nr:hypothetical protein [Vicinamibacterales bacterium]